MAYRVDFSLRAQEDLGRIADWMEGEGLDSALLKLDESVDRLVGVIKSFPDAYPRVSDPYLHCRRVRMAVVNPYLVFYRVGERRDLYENGELVEHAEVDGTEGVVVVLRVLRQGTNWRSLLMKDAR